MKVKTIFAYTEKGFDKKVNAFISDESIEVIKMDFTSPVFVFCVYVTYKEK